MVALLLYLHYILYFFWLFSQLVVCRTCLHKPYCSHSTPIIPRTYCTDFHQPVPTPSEQQKMF